MTAARLNPATPVLVAVGQATQHWDAASSEPAPSPQGLQAAAARAALEDSGAASALAASISKVLVIRANLDSVKGAKHPFGHPKSPPAALLRALGAGAPELGAVDLVYSVVGGDQPQALVNEAAEDIFAGRAKSVLIAGSEALGAMKQALKARLKLDWSDPSDAAFEDRGLGPELLSEYEINNGLGMPTQTYPAFEHALRARLGNSRETHVALMSELWEGFATVASQNPWSQFGEAKSRDFLSTASKENYPVADPYLKWHVAQDAVNQGAAIILTSVGEAERLGIDPRKWIYLHGYAAAKDRLVTQRPDLSRSRAIELALSAALDAAGKRAGDIALFDLYSCFPCAVLLAAEALGLDWRRNTPTVTGGLPFFGGPGNSYSLHAIATMAERLRAAPDQFGLILANGGFLSKEAVGIYSAVPKADWQAVSSATIQAQIDAADAPPLLSETCEATVETYTVTYSKGRPSRGYVIARSKNGRILARARKGHRATLAALAVHDPVGTTIRITHQGGTNYIEADDRIGLPAPDHGLVRTFDEVIVERRGHVLEVTLNRPDNLNALHSGVHFALHEIFDDYEADNDLWVAVITGAGDRAFCSGNDLKVTARGGDMSMPPSGFAGLCNRFNRTKPIIAAVNGIAMGGGLEIALACDLAIADETARFALPEVKVGLFAAAGGVHRLTQQIGRKAAMELILSGRTFPASEALELGLINQCVAQGTCLSAARAMAAIIEQNSPTAIRASLEALNQLDNSGSIEQALAANDRIFGRLMRTKDFREGVTAFAEKRPPNWKGA